MPCQRCIDALQEAASVLRELAYFDVDRLPPGRDWAALATELVQLAGHLRRQQHPPTTTQE